MAVFVKLLPEDQEENEYATPCFFKFDDMEEVVPFLRVVAKNGIDIGMYIRESE